tara:strand:+ start:1612 stop:3483 length:1872 start_codon:yes stop_codon:yes gene_type:complete
MKRYLLSIFILCCLFTNGQQYQWTGSSENLDFFDELNWKDTTTSEIPSDDSINPGQAIEFELYITCEVVANNDINLGENGKITIINGQLNGDSISGVGNIVMDESSYLNLDGSYPIEEGLSVTFESNKSWIRLNNVEPFTTYYYYSDNFFQENQVLSYPETLRIDNYYQNGSVVRPNHDNSSNLTVFSENNFNGEFGNISNSDVFADESIPSNLNNNISSFKLKKGFMATFAENNDGTGNSKVFIASKDDIVIDELSDYLNNKISFIRVLPWNWVSKKGTAGDIQYMNNNWFYKWSNNGDSDLDREYTPMAWGKGAADDDNDIEIIKSKYKSTHILAFNEPDDCNGQSGQYGNMCVVDTSLTYYKNLLKSGLRMVSPACRQDAVFSWLNEFNSKAIDENIRIDVIAVHWYDWGSNPQNSPNANPQDVFNRFVNYLGSVHQMYGLPIWITEFNANRHRNEWVHRQFLQLALPFLEETDYIERYSFFPPTTQVANFFDDNNNFTQIGEFYYNFNSSESMQEETYASTSNLNSENYNFQEIECNPENEFLSINSNESYENITLYPNPSVNYINIDSNEEIWKLEIIKMNGEKINVFPFSKNIDISFLSKGIYILNFNNYFIKFVKK